MRVKPDVSEFEQKPKDPDAFLKGGESDFAETPAAPETAQARTVTFEVKKPEPTVQKMFRLRWDTAAALKAGAAQETATQSRRVTETEIVERLLRKHYELDS